ncbi:hypothetical protein GCM10022254_55810 [Actinomadura meridiana]|uniref:Small secreted protein n=1 Tax=Actinomadura meridiana TaxID=559626 RepID=A0ABP8CFR2_9ACTN
MRMSAAKLVGALVVGGLMLGSTGCGAVDAATGGKKSTACKNIESELRTFSTSASVTSPDGASTAAQKFTDTAAKVRSEGQNAGGDVETAATAFAGDLDKSAEMLRKLSSGDFSSAGQPNTADLQQHGNDLADACGFSGFRLGG